ncbi:hypothetical protein [Ectobacillus polymachus]|uniref:hypothetical protein n=1 Tax=Ectobacillus polymachus TaxID=1508806 RepID=UPI003A844A1D
MTKFSSKCREEVVLKYLVGKGCLSKPVKKYGIGSPQTILNWMNRYKKYGGSAFDIRSTLL